ncbi:transglycosylase domain-containing protein [Luteipulveratus flavus]|uniref:Transglycosylase domain-containing protein n=1 Tax=Luteipulveratus flavus TaxID=3031728 RepID=A0ABT6C7A8_9MICO|nr:transglycosylase domain-containing protein [Luteipulveratus sp. YIM 133296]MDF8264826.1 transglycosylase domain-containing protein [Luteipulveratus sp. YIM 133296]
MRQATRMANVLSLLGALLATSMVLGLLAAGLVLPAVGATGQAAKKSVSMFNGLPSDFELNPLNQQSRILAADGSVIATPYDENRIVVPLSKISPLMQQAQVAIEDKRFFEHGGVDPQGLARAVVSNVVSSGTQGASTLTQQYVKVVMQSQALKSGDKQAAQDAISRTGTEGYLRKLQQLKYAVTLEQKMSKTQILEGYLNTVYFGDQQYGVEAAAKHYFNVPASRLSVSQAATLAGVVQRPGQTDPIHDPQASTARRNTVLDRMLEQKYITPEQHAQARARKMSDDLRVTNFDQSCAQKKQYAYFCYYVQDWLLGQPALGKTPRERLRALQAGGLQVQTAMDPKKMATIDRTLKSRVPVADPADIQTAAVMIQPGTGLVQAMGQNTVYSNTRGAGKTGLNYVVPTPSSSGFNIGSSAKLFSIVTALKEGRQINSTVKVPAYNETRGEDKDPAVKFTSKDFPLKACGLGRSPRGDWHVRNDTTFSPGPRTLPVLLGQSINTGFAELVKEVGSCNVHKTVTDFGMKRVNGDPIYRGPSAVTLGDNSSPLMLANAYATVAAGGKYCSPRPVISIKNSQGKALPLKVDPCKQVISPQIAAGTVSIFHAPFNVPSGTATKSKLAGGRDAFGKTGTMNQAISTWFVGSTPQLTTAVWVGRADDGPNGGKHNDDGTLIAMKGIKLPGLDTGDEYVFGGTLAAPMWKTIMDETLKGQPMLRFPAPPATMVGTAPPDAMTTIKDPGASNPTSSPTSQPTGTKGKKK